jgi:hypothetical protein
MKEYTMIEVITSAERSQIAGRFALVGKGDNYRVIGTVGNLWPHDLNRRQKQFIAAWYFLDQDGSYTFEVLPSYPESTLPPRNFNGFLLIRKENA